MMSGFYGAESVRANHDRDSGGRGNKGHWWSSGSTNSLAKKPICLEHPFKKVRLLQLLTQNLKTCSSWPPSRSRAARALQSRDKHMVHFPTSTSSHQGRVTPPSQPSLAPPGCSTRTPNPLPRGRSTPNHSFQICWSLLRMFGLMH